MTKSVFSPEYDEFRRRLIAARRAAKLTQIALAKRLSRPQSYVSKYERGERRLDVVEFFHVSYAIGVEPIDFLRQLYASKSRNRIAGHEKTIKFQE